MKKAVPSDDRAQARALAVSAHQALTTPSSRLIGDAVAIDQQAAVGLRWKVRRAPQFYRTGWPMAGRLPVLNYRLARGAETFEHSLKKRRNLRGVPPLDVAPMQHV